MTDRPARPSPPPATSTSAPEVGSRSAPPPNVAPPPAAPPPPEGSAPPASRAPPPAPAPVASDGSESSNGTRAPTPPPAPAPDSGSRAPIPPPSVAPDDGERPPTIPVEQTYAGDALEIGFDNIRVGKGGYSPTSIYVSKGLGVIKPAQIGLKTVEKRPSSESITQLPSMVSDTYNDLDDSEFFHCSIEYWVAKRDFDRSGNIKSTIKIPILPVGVTRVNHERLILGERSIANTFLPDVGFLMFYADPDAANIVVYRDGLVLGQSDWENVTTTTGMTPNSGSPMRTNIKIKQPLAGDIYTVCYTPSLSTTKGVPDTLSAYSTDGLSVVDLTGDLSARLVEDHLILLEDPGEDIVKSLIYLIIVLRNNTGDTSLTPAVEEYTLMIGERDPVRYSEDSF